MLFKLEPEGYKPSHAESGRIFRVEGTHVQRPEDDKELYVLEKLKGVSVGGDSEDERKGCLQDTGRILERKSTEIGSVLVKVREGEGGINHDSFVMFSSIFQIFCNKDPLHQ